MKAAVSSSSDLDRLSKYTTKGQIGKGSYGTVFLVEYGESKKQYVMKNINLTSSSAKNRLAAEQEACLLSHLQHPNIVSYKESFQDSAGVLHIIMGYCEGGDLGSRLKTYGGQLLPETRVVEWFVQIALALQYLHERNILHRDLKTQNIFLSKSDIIKVGDLGIARVLEGSCDLAHTIIGTPYYMSPELFANQPYNQKSDIWALGCCVYEMASLKHAFSARNIEALMYKVIKGRVPPMPAEYSSDLVGLVEVMMACDPHHRPSVQHILRMSFIRAHIRMFIDRTANRRRKVKADKPMRRSVPQPASQQCVDRVNEWEPPEQQDGRREEEVEKSPSDSCGGDVIVVADLSNHAKPRKADHNIPLKPAHDQGSPKLQFDSPKIPRPLPPDPPSVMKNKAGVVVRKDGQGVSSARQRRRKNRQHESSGGSSSNVSSPATKMVSCTIDTSTSFIDSPEHISDDGVGGHSYAKGPLHRVSHVKSNHAKSIIDRSPSEDVDDLFTLLDSTLQMLDPEAAPLTQCEDTPEGLPSAQELSENLASLVEGGKRNPLPSGRLGDRIRALRLECHEGLGVEVVMHVLDVLAARGDPEEAEEELKSYLGVVDYELFAAKLHQLKLCEDSLTWCK